MKSNYNTTLLYLLAFFTLGALASCSDDEDDLVLTEKVTLKLTSPLPKTVPLGESFTVNFTSNADQVTAALAHKSKPDSLFAERTVSSNEGAFSFSIDVPEDGSWSGNHLLKIAASKGSETYAIVREVIFGEPDEVDEPGVERPENLYLVGGSTVADWEPSAGIPFTTHQQDGKTYRDIFTYLTVAGDGFKVLPTQDGWEGGFGLEEDELSTSGGAGNFKVEEDGFYRIRFIEDDEAPTGFTYEVVKSSWGIIGAAANGWGDGDDVVMTGPSAKGDYTWEATVNLTADPTDGQDQFKFRENGGWDVNFGLGDEEGKLAYNGGNNIIVSAPGTYKVVLDFNPEGYSYSMTLEE